MKEITTSKLVSQTLKLPVLDVICQFTLKEKTQFSFFDELEEMYVFQTDIVSPSSNYRGLTRGCSESFHNHLVGLTNDYNYRFGSQ